MKRKNLNRTNVLLKEQLFDKINLGNITQKRVDLLSLFGFDVSEIEYLKKLKMDRIQAQYYLKDVVLEDETNVKKFILKCKILLNNLDSEKNENVGAKIKAKIRIKCKKILMAENFKYN